MNADALLKNAKKSIVSKEKRRDELARELATLEKDIAEFYKALTAITGGKVSKGKPAKAGSAGDKVARGGLMDAIMTVVPFEGSISKQDIFAKLPNANKTVIGQYLGTGVKDGTFERVGRGEYRRVAFNAEITKDTVIEVSGKKNKKAKKDDNPV